MAKDILLTEGREIPRERLDIVKIWGKDEGHYDWIVIDKEDCNVLCQGSKEYPYYVNYPIRFTSYQNAEEFVKEGTTGDIQESTWNLDVGFRSNFVEYIAFDIDEHLDPTVEEEKR